MHYLMPEYEIVGFADVWSFIESTYIIQNDTNDDKYTNINKVNLSIKSPGKM